MHETIIGGVTTLKNNNKHDILMYPTVSRAGKNVQNTRTLFKRIKVGYRLLFKIMCYLYCLFNHMLTLIYQV